MWRQQQWLVPETGTNYRNPATVSKSVTGELKPDVCSQTPNSNADTRYRFISLNPGSKPGLGGLLRRPEHRENLAAIAAG